MLNPINDTNKAVISVFDSQRKNNSFQEYNEYASINVKFSEQAQRLKIFQDDSPLVEVVKNEFDEVFGFGENKKKLFVEKLDRILLDNSL